MVLEIFKKYPPPFNPIQDELLTDERGGGKAPSLKLVADILKWWNLAWLYHTFEDSKYISHVTHSLSSADVSIFSSEISKFCYIKK